MAKQLVQEQFDEATNDKGKRSYSRTYICISDAVTDRAYDVGSYAGLPLIGDVHPDDAAAYCDKLTVKPENKDNRIGWIVTASYSDDRALDNNPANDEVKVSWTSEIYQEPIFTDTSGNGILNSAGDYFIDPVPTRDASHLIATIKSNQTSIPAWVITYQNAVNNAQITIGGLVIAAGLAKVQRIDISEGKLRNGTTFYEFSTEIHIHKDGWHLEPLDAGFREIESGALVQIKNAGDEEEVTSPALLDGAGVALTSPSPATAVFGDFTIYNELDLTTLPGIS